MFRRTSRGAALAAAFVLVVACKGKSDDGKAPAAGKATEASGPARGGTVKIPSNEPKYLNPILEPRFVVANALIFEGLVGLDAKGEPVPRLAKEWEISPDGKTVTFRLRDDVTWHDGKKLTSADVAFTYQAIKATPATTAWSTYMAPVEQVETPDERTVVVHYVAPFAPALVSWTVGILPKHVFAPDGALPGDLTAAAANREPVGTGPFKYVRWELGKRLLLEANKDWWHKRPHLDGVELVFGIGEAEMLEALRRGDIDWARIGDVSQWLQAGQTSEFLAGFQATDAVEPRLRLIAWNTQRKPLDDARVRRALTLALDRSRLISDVLYGQAQAVAAPLFPGMFGYDPSVAPLPFDLEAAKGLLAEAGAVAAPARWPLEIITVESFKSPSTEQMAAIFRRDLESLGIDLTLTFLPTKDYYERIALRDYDAVYFGWLPDIPDPDPAALLHSTQAQSGANYAAFADAEVDALVEKARTTLDRPQRKKLYEQLQRKLVELMPYTPLYSPYGHYAWRKDLEGVTARDVTPQAPLPGVAGWWIGK